MPANFYKTMCINKFCSYQYGVHTIKFLYSINSLHCLAATVLGAATTTIGGKFVGKKAKRPVSHSRNTLIKPAAVKSKIPWSRFLTLSVASAVRA
jgi:hypothetical protein